MTFAQHLTTKLAITEREAIGLQLGRELITNLLQHPEIAAGLQAYFVQRARTLFLEPALSQVNPYEAARQLGQADQAEKVLAALRTFTTDIRKLEDAYKADVQPASRPEPVDKGF